MKAKQTIMMFCMVAVLASCGNGGMKKNVTVTDTVDGAEEYGRHNVPEESTSGECPADYTYDRKTNTYTVYTANGLYAWAEAAGKDMGTNCILAADIELPTPENGGSNWLPIGNDLSRFTGTFDGAGHIIRGLIISGKDVGIYSRYYKLIGFIGYLSGGTVENLTIASASINVEGTYVIVVIGGIVGVLGSGEISACGFSGDIHVKNADGAIWAGNIAGFANASTSSVTSCWSVSAVDVSDAVYGSFFGGIVGFLVGSGTVQGCYGGDNFKGVGDHDDDEMDDTEKVDGGEFTWKEAVGMMNNEYIDNTGYRWRVNVDSATKDNIPLLLVAKNSVGQDTGVH